MKLFFIEIREKKQQHEKIYFLLFKENAAKTITTTQKKNFNSN